MRFLVGLHQLLSVADYLVKSRSVACRKLFMNCLLYDQEYLIFHSMLLSQTIIIDSHKMFLHCHFKQITLKQKIENTQSFCKLYQHTVLLEEGKQQVLHSSLRLLKLQRLNFSVAYILQISSSGGPDSIVAYYAEAVPVLFPSCI